MKNSVKQLFSLMLTLAVVFAVSSCGDDDSPQPTCAAPTIAAQGSNITVTAGQSVDVSFTVTSECGVTGANVTATGGTVGQPADPTAGTITVSFTAGSAAGAGSVVLTVTDSEGQTANATAVITIEEDPSTITVTDNISADVTWETGKTYILAGRITVLDGATLTIEPGVVVKGQAGERENATALLIARGGMLNANGTAALPIIFTSVADELTPELVANGTLASPNLSPTTNSLWGGVLILGYAPISAKGGAETAQIEGIPPSDTNGLYGGSDVNDNSGTIRYISIRHGGADIGEGNEINGLTLGGVGAGTTIEYVEVVANKDDGIEYFGGSVNTTNTVVWNVGDDSYDSDQAWSGTADNFIAVLGSTSDHGMEIDGPESATNPDGVNNYTNGTIRSLPADIDGGEYADLRSDAKVTLNNIYFFNGTPSSDLELDNNGVAQNYLDQLINMTNLQFNESHLDAADQRTDIYDIVLEKTGDGESPLDVFTTRPLESSVEIVTTATVGADVTSFAGWSWAEAAGGLDW